MAEAGGRRLLILTNPGAAKTVQITQGESLAEVSLAADSVTTLTWQA